MLNIFLDVETTGLDKSYNQIAQLSYIIADSDMNIINAKNFFLYVDCEVDPGSSAITGLTKDKLVALSGGTKFKDIANEVAFDLRDNTIICHNSKFDMGFIRKEFSSIGVEFNEFAPDEVLCTMDHYTDVLRIPGYYGRYKWPKLVEVLDWLNVSSQFVNDKACEFYGESGLAHDSRFDTYATYLIYAKALELESSR